MAWFFHRRSACDFYQMLADQSALSRQGVYALLAYCKGDEASGSRVIALEHEADEIRRQLVFALEKNLITPIEREDIYDLSRAIDDVIDYCASSVEEMRLFGLGHDASLVTMVDLLGQESDALHEAIVLLRNQPSAAADMAMRIKVCENRVEKAYRQAFITLLEGDDFRQILKMREIYRHLSNAADRGDEAANILSHIIVKMT